MNKNYIISYITLLLHNKHMLCKFMLHCSIYPQFLAVINDIIVKIFYKLYCENILIELYNVFFKGNVIFH